MYQTRNCILGEIIKEEAILCVNIVETIEEAIKSYGLLESIERKNGSLKIKFYNGQTFIVTVESA